MGSGASSAASPSSSPEPPIHQNGITYPFANQKPLEMESSQRTMVRTNQVAPIIIKDCREEYQHVVDFKEPVVHGRIADNMPEHALLKGCYFLVKDVNVNMDRLGTMSQYSTPNVRKCRGNYPVYGMGQPSRDGLTTVLKNIKDEGYSDTLVFNLRAETTIYVLDTYDMIPYSLRHQDFLLNSVCGATTCQAITDHEVQIRKEILDFATFNANNNFYFYNDLDNLRDEPHMLRVAYEDDIAVTDEIFSRHSFNNSGIQYLRMPLSPEGAMQEKDFDDFVNMFRQLPNYFDHQDMNVPALVFSCHHGEARSSMGMVLGCLMLAHKRGFPPDASKKPYPINENFPNYDRGEYYAVQRLVKHFPDGLQIKQEVDVVIDLCDELHNPRTAIMEHKRILEEEQLTLAEEAAALKRCCLHLERYCYVICFNAYLHAQYKALFGTSFTNWMQHQPELYHILRYLNISERTTTPELLLQDQRVLVADEYLYLDVLSSQMEVKTSNFRRMQGMPIYGTAQPSREGIACMVENLLSPQQGHPVVVLINLRQDVTLDCNGATYSWRERDSLADPIDMPGISSQEVEEREDFMKRAVKQKKMCQVYQDIKGGPEEKEFNSILTPCDMIEQQRLKTKPIQYYRIPMDDNHAPKEEEFGAILSVINSLDEIHTDEDGPAIVMQCHNGKGRTTTAMAIGALVLCHKRGFPYGTKPGEEERVSLPNASYTKGNYRVVEELIRRIPQGQQVKREVDFILDQCSDTMTPMHYHVREIIFVTYNKIKKAKTEKERHILKRRALQYLERYIFLILFNTYLHCERRNKWACPFAHWMKDAAAKAGVYEILDNLSFPEFESTSSPLRMRRHRWANATAKVPFRGCFL